MNSDLGVSLLKTTRQIVRATIVDKVTTVAASVAFYLLLAVFPALAATVTLASLFVEPTRLDSVVAFFSGLFPDGSTSVLVGQIHRLARAKAAGEPIVDLTPIIGFGVLIWSANKGTKAIFSGLSGIYDVTERRGSVAFTLMSLAFTAAAILFMLFSLGAVLLIPILLRWFGLAGPYAAVLGAARWLVLMIVASAGMAVVYRFGPSRRIVHWRAILLGAVVGALLWIGNSVLFEWYVSSFGGFAELYGSLSAIIGFMVWIWLSSIALLVGAELDAALTGVQKQPDTAECPAQVPHHPNWHLQRAEVGQIPRPFEGHP